MLEISRLDIWVPRTMGVKGEINFIRKEINELGLDAISNTMHQAAKFRENSLTVDGIGVAIYTKSRRIYAGAGSAQVDAFAAAISNANSEGAWKKDLKYIKSLVVCHDGTSNDWKQKMLKVFEYSDNCLVIDTDTDGKLRKVTSLRAIFPAV